MLVPVMLRMLSKMLFNRTRHTVLRVALLTAFVITAPQARASLMVEIQEVGSDVVVTGSGTLNVAALTPVATIGGAGPFLTSHSPQLFFGAGASGGAVLHSGITGPSSFGSGPAQFPASTTGNGVGMAGGIFVPVGYTSGSPLFAAMTFANTSIAAMGITPGTYTWTWGSGATSDSFVITTVTSTPEPASVLLVGSAILAWVTRRQRIAGRR